MSVQPGGSILHTAIWRRSIRLFTSYKHHEEWARVNDLFTSHLSSKDTLENASWNNSWNQKSNDSSPVVFVTRTARAGCDGKGEEIRAQDFPVASTPRFPPSHQTLRATKFSVLSETQTLREIPNLISDPPRHGGKVLLNSCWER